MRGMEDEDAEGKEKRTSRLQKRGIERFGGEIGRNCGSEH